MIGKRHVATPRRPYIEAFDGRIETSKQVGSQLSKARKEAGHPAMVARDSSRTPYQHVMDIQRSVEELFAVHEQIEAQADHFELAAEIIAGGDPDTLSTDDKFGIIESATLIRRLAEEQLAAVPEHELSEVKELAADCLKLAKRMRHDAKLCSERRLKLTEYLDTAVINAMCSDETTDKELLDLEHNTVAGQKAFEGFDFTAKDFWKEAEQFEEVLVPMNDKPGSLCWRMFKMPDGELVDRNTYAKRRLREMRRAWPHTVKGDQMDAERRQKAASKTETREQIKQKLSGVWA